MTMRLAMPVASSTCSDIETPVDQVLEADHAVDLGEDRTRERIPFGDPLAALDLVALVDLEARAVLHAMHRALGAGLVDDHDRDVARHRHQIAVRVARDVAVADLHLAVEVRLDERLVRELRRAADVERAHGELGARLADRLRRDDADRLAHVDRRAAGEIAPVAQPADAVLGLAGEHRADLHLLDAGGVDRGHSPPRRSSRPPRRSRSRRGRAASPPRCGRGCGSRATPRPCRRR